MIDVLEPQDALLKTFVDSIYIFRKGPGGLAFTAYPTANTPVALFRDAVVEESAGGIVIGASGTSACFSVACNQLWSGVRLQYRELVDEIAINFKPLGFSRFARTALGAEKVCRFATWDDRLPALFEAVFSTGDPARQLRDIEGFLLEQYRPTGDEPVLLRALALLNDTAADHKVEEIAALTGMPYKRLYRLFTANVGCSLAHYRNLVKFRASVASKVKTGRATRLVDVCYDHGYTDQPYFIRQFRKLTGERPVRFFREIACFGTGKVIVKMGGRPV